MARVKLRCIMGCSELKSSYQEKSLLSLKKYIHRIRLEKVRLGILKKAMSFLEAFLQIVSI